MRNQITLPAPQQNPDLHCNREEEQKKELWLFQKVKLLKKVWINVLQTRLITRQEDNQGIAQVIAMFLSCQQRDVTFSTSNQFGKSVTLWSAIFSSTISKPLFNLPELSTMNNVLTTLILKTLSFASFPFQKGYSFTYLLSAGSCGFYLKNCPRENLL